MYREEGGESPQQNSGLPLVTSRTSRYQCEIIISQQDCQRNLLTSYS